MKENFPEDARIINAENSVLGRFSSVIAKRLLNGEKIIVVNADKGLISGDPDVLAKEYLRKYKMKTKSNPLKGPFYPRKSEQILKRTIRGMLPYKKSRGKEAYSRLIVFSGIPDVLKEKDLEEIPQTQKINPKASYISLHELNLKI